MSGQGNPDLLSIKAGADLSSGVQFKAIVVAGTVAANNSTAIGILQNKPKSGEHAAVAVSGHMKAYVGAAVSAGDRLKVTTSGYLTGVASGDGACAKALAAASSGSIAEIYGNFGLASTTY